MNNFYKLINQLTFFCKENKINKNDICITSSSVLSVLNIRDCKDIDLFVLDKYIDIFKNSIFDIHNKYTLNGPYEKTYNEIIKNRENYFYKYGFKFCKLNLIKNMKNYRIKNNLFGEQSIKKDMNDIELIDNYNNNREKSIIIELVGGLGNRLCPILSLLKICLSNNIKLYIYWKKESFITKNGIIEMNNNINELFTIKNIKYFLPKDISNFKNIFIFNEKKNFLNIKLFNNYDTIYIRNRYYLISVNQQDILPWIPCTKSISLFKKDKYLFDLYRYKNNLIFNKEILNIVNKYLLKFSNNMLGIHIRGSDDFDDSFYRTSSFKSNLKDSKILNLFKFCEDFLKKKDSKIFLMTPFVKVEKIINEKFKEKVIIFDKKEFTYKENRSSLIGLKYALIELLIFSKCNKLIGSSGSSFSFFGWLISNNLEYNILL